MIDLKSLTQKDFDKLYEEISREKIRRRQEERTEAKERLDILLEKAMEIMESFDFRVKVFTDDEDYIYPYEFIVED